MASFVRFLFCLALGSCRRNREIQNEDEGRGRLGQPPRVKYRRVSSRRASNPVNVGPVATAFLAVRAERNRQSIGDKVRYPDIEDSSRRASNQVTLDLSPMPFPLFSGPKGLQNSAQGFNPGIVDQERCALKGRQIERSNKAEAGSDVQLSHVPIAHSDFCPAIGASFIWHPRLSPLQGEPSIFRIPRVETLG
jgi:hypothetical protein